MELKTAFGEALKKHRKAKDLTQEDFSLVSSRTYLSTLERGIKSPTLDKIDEIASIMGIHPLTILLECYSLKDGKGVDAIFEEIKKELLG